MKEQHQTSYPKEKIRILLAEGIHESAEAILREQGYQPESIRDALSEEELVERMPEIHILGIRSKTVVTEKVLDQAKVLLAIGCFCIGTNQVATEPSARIGVPVFNAPFSNTRSVAELTIAEVVMLARRVCAKSSKLHRGIWDKSASGCNEVRGKKLGIIGYGHIGPQVGLLAESFGMEVLYYDIHRKLPLGNARPVENLQHLLKNVDFLTLHVPETPLTRNMIGPSELQLMKKGSYLLNLSRGSVVDIEALASALDSGHLAGAAVDVFPYEPKSNDEKFHCALSGGDNVILTPHIGGSTEEAQAAIGQEVADSLLKYLETGSSMGAVNFPHVSLPYVSGAHRILNIHRNEPGVLRQINTIIAETGANIVSQYLATQAEIGYLIMDVEQGLSREVKHQLERIGSNIKTRLLF